MRPVDYADTLPIRNGNEPRLVKYPAPVHPLQGGYLTYKEWKPSPNQDLILFNVFCGYLTYKEWKRVCGDDANHVVDSLRIPYL